MPDELFEQPRLAAIYDALHAKRVQDIGCGTGVFALLPANRGVEVGADPARAGST